MYICIVCMYVCMYVWYSCDWSVLQSGLSVGCVADECVRHRRWRVRQLRASAHAQPTLEGIYGLYVCMYICIYVCINVCMHAMYACYVVVCLSYMLYLCMYAVVQLRTLCMYVCIQYVLFVCMYVYVYVYVYEVKYQQDHIIIYMYVFFLLPCLYVSILKCMYV